jgi:deoxyribonuclease-1-like protein
VTDIGEVWFSRLPSLPPPAPPDQPRGLITAVVCLAFLAPTAARGQPVVKPWDALLISSFNIQVFGESKLAKPQVVEILARVVRKFDIVAIQEVRAKSDDIIPRFVQAVNADGSRYHYLIGPREGRTTSKEQYVFVYDTTRVEVDPSSAGVFPDPSDRLHRPPMCARFRTRITPAQAAFTFWLVNIHTDPDEVPQELAALADVFQAMQTARPDEDDVILLGDLNAGPPEFTSFQRIPGIGWAVSGTTTNTRRTKTYDNLVFARPATSEYLGAWGVLDLQSTFGIPLDNALEVSDHNPVWAAFYPCEIRSPQQMPLAAQPTTVR